MNERLCTAPLLNERREKRGERDAEQGLAGRWTGASERWSCLVRNTSVSSVALFALVKNRKPSETRSKHVKHEQVYIL